MSSEKLYKYSGAGNDFIVLLDEGGADYYRQASTIRELCDRKSGYIADDGRIGADGLMILTTCLAAGASLDEAELTSQDNKEAVDFKMEFYNPDGSGGMMCGNGGRCIAAFADEMGLRPRQEGVLRFVAADGLHTAQILSSSGTVKQVRLKMIDALDLDRLLGGIYVYTGTRHFVKFVPNVEELDIKTQGPRYRYASDFAPVGANANFVSLLSDGRLAIRTWEKGVEDETLACGTGITAAAIAAYYSGVAPYEVSEIDGSASRREVSNGADLELCKTVGKKLKYKIQARQDELEVEFVPCCNGDVVAREVYLTGPAEIIKK